MYQYYGTRRTPQSAPIPGKKQVQNNAGGYVFAIDKWKKLHRFLILGTEGGTYYVGEQELTRENANNLVNCVQENGLRVVQEVVDVSVAGRAPKNDPALFALAAVSGLGNQKERKAAFQSLPKVARIGTHLFHFAAYMEAFRGWGKLARRAFGEWYTEKPIDRLVYQILKYKQRDGWSHRDILRLAHPKPPNDLYSWLFKYAIEGWPEGMTPGPEPSGPLAQIGAVEYLKRTDSEREVVRIIETYGLTREMVSTKWLNSPAVWEALLREMPVMATIRNLGKMTSTGLISPMSDAVKVICDRITNQDILRRARVHPLAMLVALRTYQQGHGMKGSLKWEPVAQVVDALDEAFYLSFGNVQPTGKRIVLALDVSGSMGFSNIAGMPITPREASAAMAMVTARTERNYAVLGFAHNITGLDISPRQRLDDVINRISGLPFSSTDCALPAIWATEKRVMVDAFVVYTDNETWYGNIHPIQALDEYRRKFNPNARLVVVAMTPTSFSIADPDDAGMLDVSGFDTATPNIISDFISGKI